MRAAPPAPVKPPQIVVEAPAREAATVPERVEGPPRRVVELVEAKAAYSWFSLLGRPGRLLAGVTDGSRTWFVSEGDVLPRGGVVERISGRPPGVEVAGWVFCHGPGSRWRWPTWGVRTRGLARQPGRRRRGAGGGSDGAKDRFDWARRG